MEEPLASPVRFVGPFERHEVVVNGWQVPLLAAYPQPGGHVGLSLDERFGLDLSVQEAERMVPFIAHCIAVALGFASHPDTDTDDPKQLPQLRPRRMIGLEIQADSAN